jgi:LysM repeat protein
MNKPNPFLSPNLLEQKNKAHARLKMAVFFSLSIGVVCLMAMLIQGCRKPQEATEPVTDTNAQPIFDATNPPVMDTNAPPVVSNVPPPPPVVDTTPPPGPSGQEYAIVKGDTFSSIAKHYGVSLKAIQDANPSVDPKKLKIGQKILVPAPTSGVNAVPSAVSAPMSGGTMGDEETYKVKSGDTLSKIAKAHGTTVKAIQSANNLTTTSIKVGQTLKIPVKTAAPAPTPAPVETAPAPMTPPPTH